MRQAHEADVGVRHRTEPADPCSELLRGSRHGLNSLQESSSGTPLSPSRIDGRTE
uniref:Uncharacterized protein n=1 Tax=Streptomyces albogriseolus TaxID=1887 RepID=V9XQN0_STRAO|nr:hypothetical protein [Streptomyces albogriseolus]